MDLAKKLEIITQPKSMIKRIPILLTASSISPTAQAARQSIESGIKRRFPDTPVLWGYNQRSVNRARSQGREDILLVSEQLETLINRGCHEAIVQSLQLLPGSEFHGLVR